MKTFNLEFLLLNIDYHTVKEKHDSETFNNKQFIMKFITHSVPIDNRTTNIPSVTKLHSILQ